MISGGPTDSRVEASNTQPISPAQRPFIAAHLRHPGIALNNMALLVHFPGAIDPDILSAAFDHVVAEYDVLRTQIDDRLALDGQLLIAATPPAHSMLERVPIDQRFAWAQERAEHTLDLARCCYDSVILDHGEGGTSWYVNLHHVITDATGSANVIDLTAQHYGQIAATANHDERAATALSSALANATKSPRIAEDTDGAAVRIDGAELYRRTPRPTTEIVATEVALDGGRGQSCREAVELGDYRLLTPNLGWTALLVTATAILIHRLTRRPKVRLIVPVHRRDRTNAELPGLAMQMMLLEVEPRIDDTHQSLHARVARTLFDNLRSDHVDWVVGDADAMVNVVPDRAPTRFGDHAVETHWIYSRHEAPELALRLHLTGYGVAESGPEPARLQLDINRGGASPDQLTRCPDHLGVILDAMIDDPAASIGARELCLADERAALAPWESAPAAHPEEFVSVVERLRIALATCDDVAVECAATGEQWRGRDYWRWVEAFARRLVADGGGPDKRVAIELAMSVEALVAIHAALVAGASFVPIDPEAPEIRRADLTRRARPSVVVSDAAAVRAAYPDDGDGFSEALPNPSTHDEAYVMFTSGSTGTPKGVPITHGGLAWHLDWAIENHMRDRGPVAAPLFGALGFDLTITSLFAPLVANGRLVVFQGPGRSAILDIANRRDLTWCKATPSHMELFVREVAPGHALTTLVTNGEAFPPELATKLSAALPNLQMVNEYGPTEAVVGCAFGFIQPDRDGSSTSVAFGGPAANTTLRVVDAFDQRTPLGVPGELLISHPHLMAGYLAVDDEAVTDPFVVLDDMRFYRSGDLVLLDDERGYVHLARIDNQLKVGGVRVEPAEIEQAITSHPAVQRAVVDTTQSVAETPTLTAWFEVAVNAEITPSEMHSFVASILPPTMVPTAFVSMTSIPMTENGKLDRRALPQPDRRHLRTTSAPTEASTNLERQVLDVWQRVLDVGPIGLDDDFFSLGGSSLGALRMLSELEDALETTIDIDLAFSHSTPRSFAASIDALPTHEASARRDLRPPPRLPTSDEPPPLTIPERSILFEQRVRSDAVMYNVGRSFSLNGRVDAEAFGAAIEAAAQRHEPLRYSYSSPRQLRSSVVELVHGERPDIDVAIAELHRRPFDLQRGPAVRVGVFGHDERTTIALVVHHVCIDGAGLERLFADAATLLTGRDLDALETSYGAFSEWQSQDDEASQAFWLEHEVGDGVRPFATLPHDEPDGFLRRRPAVTAEQLRTLPATPIALAAAAAAIAIAPRWSEPQTSTVDLGVIASTRTHERAVPLIGYLVNLIPTTVRIGADATLEALIEQAGRSIGQALPHRSMPIAEVLRHRRQANRTLPPTDVLVAFVDLPDLELDGQHVHQRVHWNGDAVADLTFFLEIHGHDVVQVALEYRGASVGQSIASTLLDRFADAVERAVATTTSPAIGDGPDTASTASASRAPTESSLPQNEATSDIIRSLGRRAARMTRRLRSSTDPDARGPVTDR